MKKSRFISIIIIMVLALMLVGCDLSGGGDDLGENEAKIKNSESTFVGSQYQEVVDKLQEWGFTNIETVAVYDIVWGITKEGTTKSVTIDGSNNYKSGDVFNKDVAIIVTYSMKESNDPAKKHMILFGKNHDGTTLKTDKLTLGTTPIYTGKEPTRESNGAIKYLFNGWSPEIEVVAESKTYTAMYTEVENLFTITFNLDGGQWGLENTQSVIYNDKITSVVPIKEGFVFNGWVIKGFWSDTKFDTETSIKENYTLTATWTTIKYIVKYDLDGGTWSRSNEESLSSNEKITTTNPTKAGHSFMGWFIDGVKFDVNTPISSDINLKAHWYFINYEEILSGRWEGWNSAAKAHGFEFIEFDGTFNNIDGKRTSTLIDFDYKWATFTLNGNVMVINFASGPISFTVSYNANTERITLNGTGYPNMVLQKTEDEPNSIAWKWQHLYDFAKTQSSLKSDDLGNYYEIGMTYKSINISPNNIQVETNRQVMKVYQNKTIDIIFYYEGVIDPNIKMNVRVAFDYNKVLNNQINDALISIRIGSYIMETQTAVISIEYDPSNVFFFKLENPVSAINNFPISNSAVFGDLYYYSGTLVLYNFSDFLIKEHGIYMFTK